MFTFQWYRKPKDHNDIYVLVKGPSGFNNDQCYVCAVQVSDDQPIMRHPEEDKVHWVLGDRIKVDGMTVEPCRMDVDTMPSPDWLEAITPDQVHPTLAKVIEAQFEYMGFV